MRYPNHFTRIGGKHLQAAPPDLLAKTDGFRWRFSQQNESIDFCVGKLTSLHMTGV